MKKEKRYLIIFNFIIIILTILLLSITVNNNNNIKRLVKNNNEEKISINESHEKEELNIESDAYSYLPENVKEIIKEKYEEDETVILTEKNKIKNESYLNPRYVEYMSLSNEEKKIFSAAPSMLTNDYTGTDYEEISNATFDMRELNNKTFLNASKDQGSSGLCWAYASNSSFETFVNRKYNDKINLSEKHLDYITVASSTIEGYNPYAASRSYVLYDGGNFQQFELPTLYSVSVFQTSDFNYGLTSTAKLNISKMYDKKKVKYLLTGTENYASLDIPTLSKSENADDKKLYNDYINYIKQSVYNEGSVYIAAAVPDTRAKACYFGNKNLVNITKSDYSECGTGNSFPGHALAVVGWDDNYDYSYCQYSTSTQQTTKENCTGKWITGKGAWILRNSWGNSNPYFYLAYQSYSGEVARVSDAVLNTYDNTYDDKIIYKKNENIKNYKGQRETSFFKGDFSEKLNRVNFYTTTADNTYDIYVSKTGNDSDYELIRSNFYKEYSGIASVDISNNNINLEKNNFKVKIVSLSKNTSNISNMVVFTNDNKSISKEVSKSVNINTTINKDINENKTLQLYTHTKNIPDGSKLVYEVHDKNDTIINNIIATSSYVVNDKCSTNITIPYNVTDEEYTLVTKYNNNIIDDTTKINVKYIENSEISGSGTKSDPYILTNAKQFENIKSNLTAYYKLENDIDFCEYSNFEPIGLSSSFKGHIIGNNKTIKNLTIKHSEDYTGLFSKLENAYIEDLNFENCNILGGTYVGTIAGYAEKSSLKNINSYNSLIYGNSLVGGILGQGKELTLITKLHNESEVGAVSAVGGVAGSLLSTSASYLSNYGNVDCQSSIVGGIVGYFVNQKTDSTILDVKNMFNIGKLTSSGSMYSAGIFGYLIGNVGINNIFNTGDINGSAYVGGLFGYVNGTGYLSNFNLTIDNAYNIGNVNATRNYSDVLGYEYLFTSTKYSKTSYKNIYYLKNIEQIASLSTLENVEKIDINKMHDLNNIPNLDNNIWHINNNTYPTLKDFDFNFTSDLNVNDMTLTLGNSKKINYNVVPSNATYPNLKIENNNSDIGTLDKNNTFTCSKTGTANIKITSNDGTNISKTLKVNCVKPEPIKEENNVSYAPIADKVVNKKNTNLSYVKIDKLPFKFKSDIHEYNLDIDYNISKIKFTYKTEDSSATVKFNGPTYLSVGKNIYSIEVTNGIDKSSYKFIINREKEYIEIDDDNEKLTSLLKEDSNKLIVVNLKNADKVVTKEILDLLKDNDSSLKYNVYNDNKLLYTININGKDLINTTSNLNLDINLNNDTYDINDVYYNFNFNNLDFNGKVYLTINNNLLKDKAYLYKIVNNKFKFIKEVDSNKVEINSNENYLLVQNKIVEQIDDEKIDSKNNIILIIFIILLLLINGLFLFVFLNKKNKKDKDNL